jgi:phenylacetate-CoA ligase
MHDYFRIAYHLGNLIRHTRWSKGKLSEYRNSKIRKIVRYAYENVPFYHEKFRRSGLKPTAVRGVDDLKKLPVVRRRELQENPSKVISDEFDINSLKKISTTGSTGCPMSAYITNGEDAFRKAKLLRANTVCGQRPRDKWVIITAPQHQAHKYRLQEFLGIYNPIPISVFDTADAQISAIEKIKPDVLDGYSSSIALLAKEVDKKGVRTISPRIIVGGAELIDNSERQLVEEVFKAPFYDEYACVELERLAWQCREKKGYHIDADSVVMEFLDETGEEVAPGESGEIVCTSLFNYAMPFVRYAVGDVGRASREDGCPCGIEFPQMKVVEGRKDSVVLFPGGKVLSPLAIGDCMTIFAYIDHIRQYRMIQKRVDYVEFLVERRDSDVREDVIEAELLAHLRRTLNIPESDVAIEIEFVDEIPVDATGKLRKVISELKS